MKALIICVIFTSIAARFLHLEADFPWGFTWEGSPYTDEGWYSYGAISYVITGNWYIEGDFNAIINVPIVHLFQAITFKILGLSLFSARVTEILFYLGIILLSYLLVRKYINPLTALVTALLLSANFTLFVHSRLAITELPMASIGFASIFIALYFPAKRYLLLGSIIALTLFMAILTKATAMLLLPAVLYAAYIRQNHMKQRLYACLWISGLLIVSLFLYHTVGKSLYPEDYMYFSSRVFTSRFNFNPLFILHNIPRTLWNGIFLDNLMYPLTLTMTLFPVFLLVSKQYRENPLVVLCYIWLFVAFATLSLCKYQPPRYYLYLSIPLMILFSIIVVSLYYSLKSSYWSYLPVAVLAVIVTINISHMTRYLLEPKYSFLTMAQNIQQHIAYEGGQDPILLGKIANSVTLATGIPSINDSLLGTRDLSWRISRYKPTHYVSLGIDQKVIQILKQSYDLEQLATYEVFGNYYGGKRVHFYKLRPKLHG